MTPLTCISPIDGRYFTQTQSLSPYFSEFALMRYRVWVEIEYFIALCELNLPQLQSFDKNNFSILRDFYHNFSINDAEKIKNIEKTTNHDVKAVEYFIKDFFAQNGWQEFSEFVHFGLTSQDINNTAIPLSLKEAIQAEILPTLQNILNQIEQKGQEWRAIPMLARTHGQPATPTTMGKEWLVFAERLKQQIQLLLQIPFSAKFGGATGNMNAHFVAFPEIDWHAFATKFLASLGLQRSYPTTQIEHYDHLAAILDSLKRLNNILIDFARDIWQYVAMEYFKQKIKAGEVGSSAMPHKVNPIDFENAEGNLGYANAIFEHLSAKLPISRLQRDLTDSTVLRNLGVPIAHSFIAYKSLLRGIEKLQLNEVALQKDLDENWAVVAEAIQTILRREKYPQAYEVLKNLTRTNEKITQKTIIDFIETLDLAENVKQELKSITPFNYLGKF
ncbi:adenylosuccinate lyase [Raineya orbicola]|uniref:Adenylosuccinate lyase n=1 Tax=Raineya orbicola TaxID=2016530 RepID=A0A2N3IF79_9BACT|nr:adenylosuccinate lyase [Raineya orbicola]PKQ68970.1 purB: adenylosuccinate lyase [Raineya orbicola]